MASSVNFITGNPEADAYDKSQNQATKLGAVDQQLGVDTAVRQGVNNMLDQSSQPQPSYQPPMAAPPPQPTASPAPALQTVTAQAESGGNPTAVNKGGYSGKYQFGKQALIDAGIYQPAPHEDISAQAQQPGQWWGTFNVPGHGALTYQQWLNNPAAQDASYQAHQTHLSQEITRRGLDKYIGQTVGGVPITQASLIEMMHGGGPEGTQRFLQTGGAWNPADTNKTSIAQFGMRVAGGAPVQAPPSPGPSPDITLAGSTSQPAGGMFMPGMNTSRYDPILRSLAATPGGGQAALGLLQTQGRFDQQNYKRTDVYQRLAMQAMAHGDPVTAKYYAGLGGINVPEQVFSNQNNMALLGRGSLVAHQFYGGDPQQAQVYLQTFLHTGSADAAFAAAGVPRSKPQTTVQMIRQADGSLQANLIDRQAGTAQPVLDQSGNPLTSAPKPTPDKSAMTPNNLAVAYRGFMYQSTETDPGRQQAEVAQKMTNLYGPGWQEAIKRAMPGGVPAAPPTGGQAMPPPAQTEGGAPPAAPAYQPPAAAPPPTPQTGTATPQAVATPGQGGPMAAPTPQDQAVSIANARQAIARGVPRQLVLQRLQANHIPIPPDL